MQSGIYNDNAELKAEEHGIDVIYNRCMMEQQMRLFSEEAEWNSVTLDLISLLRLWYAYQLRQVIIDLYFS